MPGREPDLAVIIAERKPRGIPRAPGDPVEARLDCGEGGRVAELADERGDGGGIGSAGEADQHASIVGSGTLEQDPQASGYRGVRHAGGMPSRAPTPLPEVRAALGVLADRARRLHAASGGRIVLGITGSPGAGKTMLAQRFVTALNEGANTSAETTAAPVAVHLPMDGFHLANATLDRLGLRERKGAIETFDGWGFVALLERVRREVDHVVYAPAFERHVDEPVAGEIAIEASARFVVVEGNYLLSDVEPWQGVRDLLDEAWFCDTDDDERMHRLVRRHTEFGRSIEAARAWATEVDGANARGIAPARERADVVVSGVTWEIVAAGD
ncbi:nucleoside/nucleotide kinase family protein [Agromyces sp. Soil535]|uniref:nucleoside/nucleotide kinase family protein n=1 Tax=Agromyces sp. Soil535 TaxID=1736390 RepID=UPI000A9059E7